MMPSLRSLSLLLQLLSSWTCVLGTSSPLTAAGVDKKIDEDFYPIVNGLPPGFVFGTASAAYQASVALNVQVVSTHLGKWLFWSSRLF